jgi:hypothetical protein
LMQSLKQLAAMDGAIVWEEDGPTPKRNNLLSDFTVRF